MIYNELYNQSERYTKYFLEIIKDLKKARPTKDYKELKITKRPEPYQLMYSMSSSYEFIDNYKFSEIEFLCFKFYYLLKYKDCINDDLCKLFDNFESYMKPNYLKYINIFVFIFTSKYNFEKILELVIALVEYKFKFNDDYELYLEYLQNLFFYNFFLITDIIKNIIFDINNCTSQYMSYKDIIKYIQPLKNILSWSIMREIWIYLCIFAQPKK